MGGVKAEWMEAEERGWSSSDDWVCSACVNEAYLCAAIGEGSEPDEECSYCGASSAAPMDLLMGLFMDGVRRLYSRAVDGLYWDGREGGYLGPTIESWDLVDEFGVFENWELANAVRDLVHDDTWVAADFPRDSEDKVLAGSWRRFCEVVKFQMRYLIPLHTDDLDAEEYGEVPVSRILHAVGHVIEAMALVHKMPAGARWWRAHYSPKPSIPHSASWLGTVPAELAKQPNRMSPPGIPMFYGAEDVDTACRETVPDGAVGSVTWGQFETSQDCWVVDLSNLPPVPSIFDPGLAWAYHSMRFLHAFVEDLRSTVRPDWEAVDYVPTQVLTEFLTRVFKAEHPISGLIYTSTTTGKAAVALTVLNDACVEQEPGWNTEPGAGLRLGLDASTVTARALPERA